MTLTVLDLAILAQKSYDLPPTYEVNNVELVLTITDEAAIFTTRGTDSDYEDLLRDMRAFPWRDRELGWGHRGFQLGAVDLWPELENDLMAAVANNLKIIFNGHSLGGAVSTNLAGLCVLRLTIPFALVTWGSPRVAIGNKLNNILKPIPHRLRMVNGADAVTDHPWTYWGYGFNHVDYLVEFGIPNHRWHNHRIGEYIERRRGMEPLILIP